MPDFPLGIQDLIRGMMTVDPGARFTMEQIKSHPAFLYTLPTNYIVPSPISVPDLSSPIDPASVDPQMIQNLVQIGIEPQEINEALISEATNVVKLFLMMMSRRIQLDQLPWATANTSLLPSSTDAFHNINDAEFGAGQIGINIQRRKKVPDVSSPDQMFSLAVRQTWLSDEPTAEFQFEDEVGQTTMPLPSLMWELEKSVIDCGFMFFHPDDLTILGKNETDTYLSLAASYVTTDGIQINLKMNNVASDLHNVVLSRIREFLETTSATEY